MVQIDIPAGFVMSMLMLDIGREAVKKEGSADPTDRPKIYYRFLARSVLFAGLVIAPAGISLLAGWPGWEQLYWTERVENVIYQPFNAMLPAMFVMAIIGAAWLGHWIGYRLLVTGKEKLLRPVYLGVLAAVTVVVLACYPSFTVVGSYKEYHADPSVMPSAWSNPHGFGTGWLIVMIYFSVAFVLTFLSARKEAKAAL